MSAERTPPPDELARRRISDDLDATLFVEAGAGAGKTSSLVARIVNLVESGIAITGIAAITFTEKAAAELRSRVRHALEASASPAAAAALERLDHAPIGTLHAFARRMLYEFPIDAGLPPGFTVLDELESSLEFEEQWHDLLDRLLDVADPTTGSLAGGRTLVELCEFDRFGVATGMRRMAEDFRANWDLVAERVDLDGPGPFELDTAAVVDLARHIATTQVPPDDAQADLVAAIGTSATRIDPASGETLRTKLEALVDIETSTGGRTGRRARGNKQNWKAAFGADGADRLEALRHDEARLGQLAADVLERVRRHRRLLVGAIVGRFVLDGAASRARAGRLEFHDLLVLARQLLATVPTVRAALHERYPRLLLDEFQDTDPIQLELAVRITAAPHDTAQAPERSWRELRPLPGRLFIVGDPKQSIYRFRRADIAQYLGAADQVGADREWLSANFRSTRAVIEFVNDVFGRLITFQPGAQPAFGALDVCRRTDATGHGSVTVLGAERHHDLPHTGTFEGEGSADVLRAREAADVAAAVSTALGAGWAVFDEALGRHRPCRPGDICILLPTRISLPALEHALRDAGVPYRAENSSVVYATREVRDLLLALRAADDPTDALALVESLRSPLYGITDVELWEWARARGSWNLFAPPPDGLGVHPVAEAIAHVRSVAERVAWVAPADLLAAIADERRAFDLALIDGDPRDTWRRLRYVIEQARAWADAGGHGVRRYLGWARLQASESRLADTILPEDDHDAVSVMTIHAAKGLEFPITVVAGMTTRPKRSTTNGVVWADDTWMLAGRGDEGVFDAHVPIDEQMSDAERRRLLYVACTRAVDHLVVSLHRSQLPKSGELDENAMSGAELLHSVGDAGRWPGLSPDPATPPTPVPNVQRDVELPWADPVRWRGERDRALAAAARRTGIAATRLSEELAGIDEQSTTDDPGLDKQPVNVELPPWQRGRYGTSIGRAVHGVLQFCDLATGHDIDNLARAQCAAEGVLGLEGQVAALARSALQAPVVRSVVDGAPHWRELFVAAPVGDRVVEGYVDLLVRTPNGLVIIDYKTDQWSGGAQAAERVGRYRLQLAAYGAALEVGIGEAVTGGVLVHCVAGRPAEQIEVADWSGALDEVRAAVAARA